MNTDDNPQPLTPAGMKIGGRYNWKSQPERLVYLGRNWSINGWWHQFRKIGDSRDVWCEVVDSDLHMLEETRAEHPNHSTQKGQSELLVVAGESNVGTTQLPEGLELWHATEGCEHNIQPAIGGGVKCTKCPGWFCR